MLPRRCYALSVTRTDEEHNATLATVAVIFGDVRATDEVLALLNARPNV
jgi:hypothetical protein